MKREQTTTSESLTNEVAAAHMSLDTFTNTFGRVCGQIKADKESIIL